MTTDQDPTPPHGIERPQSILISEWIRQDERLDECERRLNALEALAARPVDDGFSDEDMRQLSDRLWAEAEARSLDATRSTREQWNQVQCLREAAMRLYSVYAWGQRAAHPTRHETDSNDKGAASPLREETRIAQGEGGP